MNSLPYPSPTHFVIHFAILFFLVIVYFVMLHLLLTRLARHHHRSFVALDRPRFPLHMTLCSQILMLKFIFLREHRPLADRALSRLSDGMLIFQIVYLFILIFPWFVFHQP